MFDIIIEESIYIIFLEIISFVLSPQKFLTILGHLYECLYHDGILYSLR